MIKSKDIGVYIALLLLIAFIAKGDDEVRFLGGVHLLTVHLMIFIFLRDYKNMFFKRIGVTVNLLTLGFTITWYFFSIQTDNLLCLGLFLAALIVIVIGNKW